MHPSEADPLLTRQQAASTLTEAGFKTSPATLATLATRGGGPPFQHFGRRTLYRRAAALAWAEGRLGRVVSSTAELRAGC